MLIGQRLKTTTLLTYQDFSLSLMGEDSLVTLLGGKAYGNPCRTDEHSGYWVQGGKFTLQF